MPKTTTKSNRVRQPDSAHNTNDDLAARLAAEAALLRQNAYLSALHETTLGVMRRLDLNDLLETIVNRATHLLGASFGWLYLVDPKSNTLEVKFGSNNSLEHVGDHLLPGEGLAGQVWQTGRPIAVDDYAVWPNRSPKFPQDAVHAAIGVPLAVEEQIIGVLGVSQTQLGVPFDEDEVTLLVRFGQLAAIAIDNARLYTAAQRQTQELALLNQIRTALARELDLTILLRTVVETIANIFDYPLVSLYLLQDGALMLQHQVGYRQVLSEIPLSRGVMARAVRTGQPVFLADVSTDPDFLDAIGGICAEICVPLHDRGQIVGVLNIESTEAGRLSDADLQLMVAVAEHVNVSIGRARLYTEVREREQQYRSVIENVREVIFQIDLHGNWTFLNPAWTSLTGFPVSESLGQFFVSFVDSEDRAALTNDFVRQIAQKQTHYHGELRYSAADGSMRWVEARAQMTYRDDGGFDGAFGVLTDVSERRLAEIELARQRDFALQVMSNMAQGLTVTGPAGQFEYVNPAFARMLDRTPEELIGKSPRDFTLPEDVAPGSTAALEDAWNRGSANASTYETRLRRADGSILYALITSAPRLRGRGIHDGPISGSITVVTDLTERKHMEEALALARDQALEASRLKSEFLATMSHEIRTPMNSILGMTDLLLDTELTREQKELAEGTQDAAQALLAIIDDILDFSKIEAGKLVFEDVEFELAKVVQRAADLLSAKAQAKNLDLRVLIAAEVPQWLRGDPLRLRQVLVNLISNAVKFTNRGEVVVEVALESMTETYASLYFSVTDTGIGLSESARRRLFQPFTQADGSMTRRYGGTGLGLAICKRLVEMMGGQVGAEGAEGQGSVFWFTAHLAYAVERGSPELGSTAHHPQRELALEPRSTAAGLSRPPREHAPESNGVRSNGVRSNGVRSNGVRSNGVRPSPAAEITAARILLAEDNPVNQRLGVLQLQKLGFSVTAVGHGKAAFDAYMKSPKGYDLILMDCQMPQMDGFEASRAIRDAEATLDRHVPIVAMTASALQGDREACLAAGMDDYISKPVRWIDLQAVVRRWIAALPAVVASTTASTTAATAERSSGGGSETPAPGPAKAEAGPLDQTILRSLRRLAPRENPQALAELINTFLDSTAARMPDLRLAVLNRDSLMISQIAHSLKGSTGSFGALRLGGLLGQLEALGKSSVFEGTAERLAEIEAEYELVRVAYHQELAAIETPEAGEGADA
jgi:PAS domain S-box-containing protein